MVRNPSNHQISRVERPSVSHASGGSPPISPFAADAPITAPPVPAPPTVSSPFVNLEGRQVESARTVHPEVHPEAGPVRLTRFVDMSLETYHASVSDMVSAGQFEHIGRATIRIEGASAWGVWLRVDHWPTALGRHPVCGVVSSTTLPTAHSLSTGLQSTQFNSNFPSSRVGHFLLSLNFLQFGRHLHHWTTTWIFSWAIFRQCRSQRSRSPVD